MAQRAQTPSHKASEEAAAKHWDELDQQHADLLPYNTVLSEQIHTLTEQLNKLTIEVHRATCMARRAEICPSSRAAGEAVGPTRNSVGAHAPVRRR